MNGIDVGQIRTIHGSPAVLYIVLGKQFGHEDMWIVLQKGHTCEQIIFVSGYYITKYTKVV